MTSTVDMPLWSTADKVPGHYGETRFGGGRMSVGSFPIVCALTGTKTSAGSMTADSSMEQSFSLDQSIALCGASSTAVQQAEAAFMVPNTNVIHLPPAEASGAVAADIEITFAGSWSTAGTIMCWFGGKRFDIAVGASDSATNVASNGVLAAGENQTMPCVATSALGVLTLTVASAGTQGNSYLFGWDLSQAPAGLTVSVSGGTALHPRLVPCSGGSGTESLTNVLALAESEVIDYWAIAQTDATNAGLVKAHLLQEAQPTIAHLEHAIFASTDTYSAASTFSSSTLNYVRCACLWYENCETHPAVIAANAAALRSSVVGGNPNHIYTDEALLAVAPQRYKEDAPSHATLMAALNHGLTPLYYKDGYVRIVRDCVSKCLTGATPNYNTYGWPDADVPDRMRKEFGAEWMARRAQNPVCRDDPAEGEASAQPGVETPRALKAAFTTVAKNAESALWIQDVDDNTIYTVFNHDRKCIMYQANIEVQSQNLQCGGVTQQVAAS